jgi:hypothetical protein
VHASSVVFLAAAAATLMPPAAGASSPVILSAQFTPPGFMWRLMPRDKSLVPGSCHVRIGEVRDARADTQAMGDIGGRPIRATDNAAWIRSGLESLSRDQSVTLGTAPAPGDWVLNAELVKAYMLSLTSDKSTTLVLRVHYAKDGTPETQQIYRAGDSGWNWSSGEGETQSQFDTALAELVVQIDTDLRAKCAAGGTAPLSP